MCERDRTRRTARISRYRKSKFLFDRMKTHVFIIVARILLWHVSNVMLVRGFERFRSEVALNDALLSVSLPFSHDSGKTYANVLDRAASTQRLRETVMIVRREFALTCTQPTKSSVFALFVASPMWICGRFWEMSNSFSGSAISLLARTDSQREHRTTGHPRAVQLTLPAAKKLKYMSR